ncbi:MAG: hypothetical protein A3J65_00295 [Candidatus Buchananbacteria bacterium RIFCSPHIGHO2_02_FULL_45_11b]|uniref:Kazal-like domain-containing protein n=1 Tax=Candidatus Buchananbacteria bacterium RIFCSPHIGHO2_02_FULL_45_11b TaxID=1797541 RepID=A0A1G1YG30_9BACT|nr:MAG: hypothetical protein A3J65_00295 [Candidatus Buchananbacteria bacterium RIFCSPHIGHO2_02_FULL_45_11b]
MFKKIFIIIAASLLLSGCQNFTLNVSKVEDAVKQEQKKAADKTSAIIKCRELCLTEASNRDLNPGPCLSNEIIPDWVCDVAHSPRQDIDNLPENQCLAFKEGKARHYVEVDGNCEVIKSY